MPNERDESLKQGIAAPDESPIAREAEARRREQLLNTPPEAQADSAMGGTSDVDAPVDDAEMLRARNERRGE